MRVAAIEYGFANPKGSLYVEYERRGLRGTGYDAEPGPRPFDRLRSAVEAAPRQVVIAAAYPLDQGRGRK